MVMAKALRAVITVLGAGIVVIGLDAVVRGADAIPGTDSAVARIDSEVRFFAAWYIVAGALLFLSAVRMERMRTAVVVAVGAGFFLAACGRALSWATVGEPEPAQVFLMIVEFVIPAVIVPWQLGVERRSRLL